MNDSNKGILDIIVSAILRGDTDAAVTAIREHGLQSSAKEILKVCIRKCNGKLDVPIINFLDCYVHQEDLLSYDDSKSVLIDFTKVLGQQKVDNAMWKKSTEIMQRFVCDLFKREDRKSIRKPLGNSIYAFRSVKAYSLSELSEERLCVSSPEEFNDPFDCLILSSIRNEQHRLEKYKERHDVKTFVEELQKIRVRCFVGINPMKPDVPPYLNTAMWGYYGDSHKGYCIKYSLESDEPLLGNCLVKGTDSFVRGRLDPVEYTCKYINRSGSLDYKSCFLVKNEDWEKENEYRLVYYDASKDSPYYTIPLSDIGLKVDAIYFGVNSSASDRALVQKIMKDKDVSFYNIAREKNYLNKLCLQEIGK